MLSIYVRKHLRVKSELGLVVEDARLHQVCPHDSPRRGSQSHRSRTRAMSNTVRSHVQDPELARQADLDWLARLDGCRLRSNRVSLGVQSVV